MECGKCKTVMEDEGAVCSDCNLNFHHECSISEINYRKTKKGTWRCSNCRTPTRSRLNTVTESTPTEISDISKKDIQEIREMFTTIQKELSDLREIRNEITELKRSVEYMSNEYDKFTKNLKEQNSEMNNLKRCVSELKRENNLKNTEIAQLKDSLVSLDQYIRNRNVEVTGVVEEENEDLKSVIVSIAKEVCVEICPSEIDVIHRVPSANKNLPKPIVVQFTNRQKRDAFLAKRQLIITNAKISGTKLAQKVYINEHLSPYFKLLLKQTKVRARDAKYKYVWFRNGKILVRKDDGAPAERITSEQDFATVFDRQ